MISYQILSAILVLFSVALAAFCIILSRRLKKLNDLETGLGGAIAVMVHEVNRLERLIRTAKDEANQATNALTAEIRRAESERHRWQLQNQLFLHEDNVDRPRTRRRNRTRSEVVNA